MKILLATDGSKYSDGAARFLARFNFSQADEITALHVIPGVPFPHSGGSYHAALMQLGEELAPMIIDETARLLKDLRANYLPAVTTGHPADAIVAMGKQTNSDLIVMGNRGMKAIGIAAPGECYAGRDDQCRAVRFGRQAAPAGSRTDHQDAICHGRICLCCGTEMVASGTLCIRSTSVDSLNRIDHSGGYS